MWLGGHQERGALLLLLQGLPHPVLDVIASREVQGEKMAVRRLPLQVTGTPHVATVLWRTSAALARARRRGEGETRHSAATRGATVEPVSSYSTGCRTVVRRRVKSFICSRVSQLRAGRARSLCRQPPGYAVCCVRGWAKTSVGFGRDQITLEDRTFTTVAPSSLIR